MMLTLLPLMLAGPEPIDPPAAWSDDPPVAWVEKSLPGPKFGPWRWEYWPKAGWVQVRDLESEVSSVRPFPPHHPEQPFTTQPTLARTVGSSNTRSAVEGRAAGIITLAPPAIRGGTNCAVG